MSRRRLLLNGLSILAAFAAVHWWQTRPLATGEAPPLKGRTVDGAAADLRAAQGRPVLVHFWAEWCPVCRLEEDGIAAIAGDHRVITVAMQSGDAARVRAYLKRHGLGFPVLADPHGAIAGDWGVRAVPTSFVIGPGGRIRFREVGFTSEAGLRARLWAAARMAGHRPPTDAAQPAQQVGFRRDPASYPVRLGPSGLTRLRTRSRIGPIGSEATPTTAMLP